MLFYHRHTRIRTSVLQHAARGFLFGILALAAPTQAGAGDEALSAEVILRQDFGSTPRYLSEGTSSELGIRLGYDWPVGIYARLDFRASTDGRYGVARQFLDVPFYFVMREGGLGYETDSLHLRAGRFTHADVVESPYSLFVSSREHSAQLYEIDIRGEWLRFLTRSVQLNRNSVHGYPDRSIVFQTIGVTRPNWEVGFQDATVAVPMPDPDGGQTSDGSGPTFVPELFFNPFPSYLNQYILGAGEAPWVQDINYKSLMGFYGVLRGETRELPWKVEGQILVDDFNANAIWNPGSEHQNPFMGAWMLSGRLDTGAGRFRLSHAGSLAYTFQTYGNRRYSYTYYPEVAFPRGGELSPIDYRENYFGFYHGPNTAAFRLDWEHELPAPPALGETIALDGELEYTISGTKSPLNPWAEYESWRDHGSDGAFTSTRYLDDDRLEHGVRLGLSGTLTRELGVGRLTVGLHGELGVWVNVLKLDELTRSSADDFPDSQDVEYYRPSDETFTLGRVGLFARYSLR